MGGSTKTGILLFRGTGDVGRVPCPHSECVREVVRSGRLQPAEAGHYKLSVHSLRVFAGRGAHPFVIVMVGRNRSRCSGREPITTRQCEVRSGTESRPYVPLGRRRGSPPSRPVRHLGPHIVKTITTNDDERTHPFSYKLSGCLPGWKPPTLSNQDAAEVDAVPAIGGCEAGG